MSESEKLETEKKRKRQKAKEIIDQLASRGKIKEEGVRRKVPSFRIKAKIPISMTSESKKKLQNKIETLEGKKMKIIINVSKFNKFRADIDVKEEDPDPSKKRLFNLKIPSQPSVLRTSLARNKNLSRTNRIIDRKKRG